MTRHGSPIRDASVRDSVDAGITFGAQFLEYEAAVAAGLDLEKWERGSYPPSFKAKIVAWYNMHNLVEIHTQDAANRQMKRK